MWPSSSGIESPSTQFPFASLNARGASLRKPSKAWHGRTMYYPPNKGRQQCGGKMDDARKLKAKMLVALKTNVKETGMPYIPK